MKYIIIALLLVISLVSCNKTEYKFEDITETNDKGELIGNIDDTDWRGFENWSDHEHELFSDSKTSMLKGGGTDPDETTGYDFEVQPAYPNSTSGVFTFNYTNNTDENISMEYVIVNKRLKVQYQQLIKEKTFTYDFSKSDSYKDGKMYRVYYRFLTDEGIVLGKGHGDIVYE